MARAVTLAASSSDAQAVTGATQLHGFSVRETGGTNPGTIQLRDGTDATGQIKATIHLAANGHQTSTVPAVEFTTGIFVDRSGTGTTEIVLYVS